MGDHDARGDRELEVIHLDFDPAEVDPVYLEVNAPPGVVLVGVWSPQLTSAQDLPSDTIRIHATGLSADDVQEARGWLNDGKVVRLRGGSIRPGVGIDPNWV